MSFRPIATRTLDNKQFERTVPPPVPNSANCPVFIEQPNFNAPIYAGGAGGGGGGGGRMPVPKQHVRRNPLQTNVMQDNLYNRQTVFNFMDRQGVNTRNGAEGEGGNIQIYNQVQQPQQSGVIMNDFLRPQNSRDMKQGYFNKAEVPPNVVVGGGGGGGGGSVGEGGAMVDRSAVSDRGAGNRTGGDANLEKYGNMYQQNMGNWRR